MFQGSRHEIQSVIRELSCNTQFQFEDWPVLSSALPDYLEYPAVDLSDRLIAGIVQKTGAITLYSFESDKKPGPSS